MCMALSSDSRKSQTCHSKGIRRGCPKTASCSPRFGAKNLHFKCSSRATLRRFARTLFSTLLRLAVSADRKALSSVVHHLLPRLPQAVDSRPHHIARFQLLRRTRPQAHARWRPRADHVSCMQGHEVADINHQLWTTEKHL